MMGKVIKLPPRINKELERLLILSDSIDEAILDAVERGANIEEVSAVLSNRLGETIKQLKSKENKAKLLDLCFDMAVKKTQL